MIFEGVEVLVCLRVNGHFKFAPANLQAQTRYIKFSIMKNINYIQLLILIIILFIYFIQFTSTINKMLIFLSS